MSQLIKQDLTGLARNLRSINMGPRIEYHNQHGRHEKDIATIKAFALDVLSTFTEAEEPIGQTARTYALTLDKDVEITCGKVHDRIKINLFKCLDSPIPISLSGYQYFLLRAREELLSLRGNLSTHPLDQFDEEEKTLLANIFAQFPDFPDLNDATLNPISFVNLSCLLKTLRDNTAEVRYIAKDIRLAEKELPGISGIIYGALYDKFGRNHQDAGNPNWASDYIGEYLDRSSEVFPDILSALKPLLIEKGALEGPLGLYAKVYEYEVAHNPDFKTDNPNWGRDHAFEDMERFIVALFYINRSEKPEHCSPFELNYSKDLTPQEAFFVLCEGLKQMFMLNFFDKALEVEKMAITFEKLLEKAEEYLPGLKSEIRQSMMEKNPGRVQDSDQLEDILQRYLYQVPNFFPKICAKLLKPKLAQANLLEGEHGLYGFAYQKNLGKPNFKTDDPQWGEKNAFQLSSIDMLEFILKSRQAMNA